MVSAHTAQANTPDHRRGRAHRAAALTDMVLGAHSAPPAPSPPSVADHGPVWRVCVSGTLRTTNLPRHQAFVEPALKCQNTSATDH
jgi:hypothetical protein